MEINDNVNIENVIMMINIKNSYTENNVKKHWLLLAQTKKNAKYMYP